MTRPPIPAIRAASAAILIIGNEILSGKVRDENLWFLASSLYGMGIPVRRVVVVPDEVEIIAGAVAELSRSYDVVFTTGGVGPTHDDVTMEGVARAFGLALVRHEELATGIRTWYGDRTNDAALKMADLPEQALLVQRPGLRFPPVLVRNVFVLPGIPSFLKDKFDAIREVLVGGEIHTARFQLKAGDTEIAAYLDSVQREFPAVAIGSYPQVDHPSCKVVLTLDSADPEMLDRAANAIRERIPADYFVT